MAAGSVPHSGVEVVDAPLVRVPFESLKRAAKERKTLVDEISEGVTSLTTLPASTPADQAAQLAALQAHLQALKRQLGEVSAAEADEAARCRARLDHLNNIGAPAKHGALAWNKHRLDRIIVDHLLRSGFNATASMLASSSGVGQLVDAHIFEGAQRVVAALQGNDCGEALAWCAEQRQRLKKLKSPLEFRLRLREFLELVRAERRLDAIHYARSHLAQWAGQYMPELQRALATLAFTAHTRCAPYKALFEEGAWASLIELFLRELYRLHNLPPESLLTIHLQAGLAALKAPLSSAQGSSKEDPLHLPAFQKLAEGLPYAKHVHSKLICAVTREVMNDGNPPIVLPNGYVYSERAVEASLAKHGGRMVCPKTGAEYSEDELRRAFIV